MQHKFVNGFTLMELLVVLVILGILIGVLYPRFAGQGDQAKARAAKVEIEQIGQALDMFKLEIGRYPTTQEGLTALVQAPGGINNWNGPYLRKNSVPKDPWNNDYRYTAPGQHGGYDLLSLGADGKEGGDGANKEVTSWQ